jgi:hypothetical protein
MGGDMTTEPPDGEEQEGTDLGRISGSQLPPELEEVRGDEGAVLFVPEGTDPSDVLNVRVVGVNPTAMRLIIMRRC